MTKQLCGLFCALAILLGATSTQAQTATKQPSLNKENTLPTQSTELPQSYKVWKEQQILDAQNLLLRAQSTVRQSESDLRSRAEKDLKKATDQVDVAKNLTVDEYLAIYLSKYQDRPELVLQMLETLPKEESKEILTGTFRKAFQQNNAKQKQTGLMIGSSQP